MSIFRVITRIIPLNSSNSTFEPASFDQLTDGNVGEVKVLNLTEPQSGMKYRIERIEYVQNAGPSETVESINNAYAEKLKRIPGFVQLKANDMPLNPYDKSFQLTLPTVLFGPSGDSVNKSQQNKSSDSFKISVVKNFNFKKASPKLKKSAESVITLDDEKEEAKDDAKFKISKSPSDSKVPFKTKYPTYLSKKLKNSVWKKKSKSSKVLKTQKHSKSNKSHNDFLHFCSLGDISLQKQNCPTSNYVQTNKDLDTRKTLDIRLSQQNHHEDDAVNYNLFDEDHIKRRNNIMNNGENGFTDDSLDSEYRDLVINVPEVMDGDSSFNGDLSKGSINDDSLLDSCVSNQMERSQVSKVASKITSDDSDICKKFIIHKDHPAHDLLVALKKYFVYGECLICGFIPSDKDFNACEHMESHVLFSSFASSYKCSCCDEKFANPRNLYMHALSREKSYKYICSICTLKFKRRHYLSRHTAKSH